VLIIAFFLRERSEQVEDERVNVPAGVPEGGRGLTQFEREVIGERVRDEIAASKAKGIWVGGSVPLGYASVNKKLVVVPEVASLRLNYRT
jgi:hypothetical protein